MFWEGIVAFRHILGSGRGEGGWCRSGSFPSWNSHPDYSSCGSHFRKAKKALLWIRKTKKNQADVKSASTRVHSSMMRTGRSLTVCPSLFLGGGVLSPGGVHLVPDGVLSLGVYLVPGGLLRRGGVWPRGVCSQECVCVCSGGCLLPGGLLGGSDPGGCLRHAPPLWTNDRQV